jgi:outer membrane protein OmpA-like peptidoglycan-associated protein
VLLENPKLIMEISSHTDSQSSSGFNLGLSNRRAKTAVDFLIANGVAKNRLKAIGYGETRLLNHCADNVPCGDEDHKINRRTEFKITKPKAK